MRLVFPTSLYLTGRHFIREQDQAIITFHRCFQKFEGILSVYMAMAKPIGSDLVQRARFFTLE
jgi:hypothetical protein